MHKRGLLTCLLSVLVLAAWPLERALAQDGGGTDPQTGGDVIDQGGAGGTGDEGQLGGAGDVGDPGQTDGNGDIEGRGDDDGDDQGIEDGTGDDSDDDPELGDDADDDADDDQGIGGDIGDDGDDQEIDDDSDDDVGPDLEDDDEEDAGDLSPLVLTVLPPHGHLRIERTRQFRLIGPMPEQPPLAAEPWVLTACSDPTDWALGDEDCAVAQIDAETGLLTALAGGSVEVGVTAEDGTTVLAETHTIYIAGGPTHVGRHGGRAFCDEDPRVRVEFPGNASERALTVLVQKRGPGDLPEKARGQALGPIFIYQFEADDAVTGEDVGGTEGFDTEVELTLGYDDQGLPEGVTEDDLVVATFNEHRGAWEQVPANRVRGVDRDNNTITVGTTHCSYWAVMEDALVEEATPVSTTSWARLKQAVPR